MPVCPLCNIPIPVKRGEPPDIKVGQHIDTDCQSDPAKEKRKVNFFNGRMFFLLSVCTSDHSFEAALFLVANSFSWVLFADLHQQMFS